MTNIRRYFVVVSYVILMLLIGSSDWSVRNASIQHDLPVQKVNSDAERSAIKSGLDPIGSPKVVDPYGRTPMVFEPNAGQTDATVRYIARGSGYTMYLTGTDAVLKLQKTAKRSNDNRSAAVRMRVVGASEGAVTTGLDPTGGISNYLIGNDPSGWYTDIPNYRRVRYESVYPGIDMVYYGDSRRLEYDFVVKPNADPSIVALSFEGATQAKLDERSGDLVLETAVGTIRQLKPYVYQQDNGERTEIASSYRTRSGGDGRIDVTIDLAEYDHSKELIIDPVLAYGSYLGGSGYDEGRGIAVDSAGNAYVVGTTTSLDFPTTPGTIKPNALPRSGVPGSYWNDAFVTKIDPTGTAVIFSTYFGGREGSEIGTGVQVDPDGNVIFSGTTTASDLPTVNAYQSTFGGTDDAFAAKLNPTGSAIIYSTYLGGNNTDTGGRIALNRATGAAVFAGSTISPNFPTTPGSYKQKLCDSPITCSGIFYSGSYIVKLSSAGNAIYSTLFDASINDVTLDTSDNALVGGAVGVLSFPTTPGSFQPASSGGVEGFLAKLNPSGNAVIYGTYLGGGFESDRVMGVAIDPLGFIYAVGRTQNAAFPVTPGVFDGTFNGGEDAFITKLDPTGSTLVYSTFFGGQGADQPFAIAIGSDGGAFIAGETFSGTTFPTRNSLIAAPASIFAARFSPDASSLVYSTLLGQGGAYALAVDSADNAYVTGVTTSVVVTPNSFQPNHGAVDSQSSPKDAFVIKIATGDENAPSFSISGTVFDDNFGFNNNDFSAITVTISGTVNRAYSPSSPGNGIATFSFGNLPAGGNYTITARKAGYVTDPVSVVFNNLGANQSADFHILRNQPPTGVITSPIHGTTFNAPATITIQATAADPDGDAIQKVDFIAYNSNTGNIPLGTDTTAPYEFTWSNVPVGTYALYAIPTDSHGLRGISTEVVHVFVVDPTVPSVEITSPTGNETFAEGDNITLSAAVSSSITIVEFYDQTNTIIGRRISAPWTTQWRVMSHGNYTITAKGYTAQGQTVFSSPVNIVVNPINHRISGTVNDSITNAPMAGVTLNLVCPRTPAITAQTTTDSNGNYLFTNLGTTPDDSVTITPSLTGYTFDPPNRSTGFLGYITNWTDQNYAAVRTTGISVAMTSPTAGQVFNAPASFGLTANASTTSGTVTKVDFYEARPTPILIGTDTTAPFEAAVTGLSAGNYGYFARATDSTNAAADSEPVYISVITPISTVRLQGVTQNPGGGPLPGITVRLAGTANGNPVIQSSVSNVNGAYGFFNLPAGGNYTITPEAPNTTFTPPSASFTNVSQDIFDIDFVASAANQPPTVQFNSPANGAVFTMPAPIPINVTAADGDGSIAHLTVSAQGRTFVQTIGEANNGSLVFNWQPNLPGEYTLWAQARDNGGLLTMASITITVNRPAAVSLSGRVVDRNSNGIDGVTLTLKDLPNETTVIANAVTDASGNYTIPGISTFHDYVLVASKTDHTFSPQRRTYFNLAVDQTNADFTGTLQVQPSDFDGDGNSDVAVWRPSSGVWHIKRSADNGYSATQFGGASFGDVVVPGNYDGDKKIDFAVFRAGVWYIMNSSDGAVRVVVFGLPDDLPVPGDYDGDGKTDIAVWRPSDGNWHILRSSDGAYDLRHFGTTGDRPVAGDYDGDGITDVAVWRPSSGVWFVLKSLDGSVSTIAFGQNGDKPVIGDFDGDKKVDFAVFRPSSGVWYLLQSSDGAFKFVQWGVSGDEPVAGDYDRDGKSDIAVFRSSSGVWYILRSSTGSFTATQFGMDGDIAIPAAYIR